jgi:hypothetical protein
MITFTVTSVSDSAGTFSLVSRVEESPESALKHLQAMGQGRPKPVYMTTSGNSWRWTWEYVTDNGLRCTDTVRMIP